MTAPPMPFIPEELHGSPIVMAFLCYAGDVEAGERVLAPFRSLATPLADMVRPMSYPEMYPPEPEGPKVIAHAHTGFVDELTSSDYSEILERLEEPVGQMRAVQLRTLGGATARRPRGRDGVRAPFSRHHGERRDDVHASGRSGRRLEPGSTGWPGDSTATTRRGT